MKRFSLVFMALGLTHGAMAQEGRPTPSSTAIELLGHATHIARISGDTVVVVTGSTYSFTVDTPEDKGLVSTGTDVVQLLGQIGSRDGSVQQYDVVNKEGLSKKEGALLSGDHLLVTSQDGKARKKYYIAVRPLALSGRLQLEQREITLETEKDLTLYFTAGQRSPDATVKIYLPPGIPVSMDNTTVNVIGRGEVTLRDLDRQSIGRVGTKYSYSKVGAVAITKSAIGTLLTFRHLDLRPANGADLKIVIRNVKLVKTGVYHFKAVYTTAQPEVLSSAGTGAETAILRAVPTLSDFERVLDKGSPYRETPTTYTQVKFRWSAAKSSGVQLMLSSDKGRSWQATPAKIDLRSSTATLAGLKPHTFYLFRLLVKEGRHKGLSNPVAFYSGKMDIKDFGVSGEDQADNTADINRAIDSISRLGGGTLLFSKGIYSVRTIHLKSNVYLYLEKGAIIKALKGADAPEATWFSDRKYRSGLSPTDKGPYEEPENWLTKQDVGHHYFRNSMFFGERLDNVKIIGNGYITGNGNLVTGDKVMNNAPDNRADKMFTLKLCTNIEIGGLQRSEDLWYDADRDEPYYIQRDGSKDFDVSNMLHIDRAGHFVLLATGTDGIHVHNTYFGKQHTTQVRDIYDFMACNHVTVTNIYSKVSSDDIVKPGSDCSLGFTRPARNYRVRNIIGDTNCNLFQIGSETADDIQDIHVDNIYVLGANKAGFSISTNDGGHIKDIHLNCGHTGSLHSRSRMYRTTTPFFISISNRGRVLGAEVGRYAFTDNGEKHNELLVKNVNIGQVENIMINGIDIAEVYGGSSFNGTRWKGYDGTQRRASPIIAGYSLPPTAAVEGGLDFTLPNGKHTGYITNVVFHDVHVLVKGGHAAADTAATPPELGVGQYNVSNLKVQPSYGLWARHVKQLTVKASSFNYEKRDSRHAVFLDDVQGALFSSVALVKAAGGGQVMGLKKASGVRLDKVICYNDTWGSDAAELQNAYRGKAAEWFLSIKKSK